MGIGKDNYRCYPRETTGNNKIWQGKQYTFWIDKIKVKNRGLLLNC
jgi:hypothetical protein